MNIKYLKSLRKKLGVQLRPEELNVIIKVLEKKTPCNFLIFGLGKDTPLWNRVNKKGRTVFLENMKEWFDKVIEKNPKTEVYMVKYTTKRRSWKKLLKNKKKLFLKLPKEIIETKWDVILVDAPRGWKDDQPGRMQSIYMASKLIKKKGHIFVHDCWREVEAVYSDKFLLRKNLVKEIKGSRVCPTGLRHYHIK